VIDRLGLALLQRLEPERAHDLALWALRRGLVGATAATPEPLLAQKLWGLEFPSPLGLAAGFDKSAVALRALGRLGFGFVEVGSVTPRPQPGNPKPRLFRLAEDRAIVNRMGFNNDGGAAVAQRLEDYRVGGGDVPIGVNLGKNKDTVEATEDYARGASRFGKLADYLVVNVSSPNTPGLRNLQTKAHLLDLSAAVARALAPLGEAKPPLLLKIAPDLDEAELSDITAVAMAHFDGLIVSNTTVQRPRSLKAAARKETGGLSGAPLFDLSTAVLAHIYGLTQGRLPLIGVGGVGDAASAYAKIRAGASLVQVYTAFIYRGPRLLSEIAKGLLDCLERDGYTHIAEAVGADHRLSISQNGSP